MLNDLTIYIKEIVCTPGEQVTEGEAETVNNGVFFVMSGQIQIYTQLQNFNQDEKNPL